MERIEHRPVKIVYCDYCGLEMQPTFACVTFKNSGKQYHFHSQYEGEDKAPCYNKWDQEGRKEPTRFGYKSADGTEFAV